MIETERLFLKKLTADDLEPMYRILSDATTMQFWPAPFDREMTKKWIRRSMDGYQNGLGRFAIISKSDHTLIGDCGFMRTEVNDKLENDLGYILDKSHWGRGFATEAARACLQYGFEKLDFKRIVASMETKHTASRAVAEKIGFQLECQFINSKNRNLPTFLLSINR